MARRLALGVSTPSGPLADRELTAWGEAVGAAPDMVLWYQDFASAPPTAEVAAVVARGATPVITWEPWLWRTDVRSDEPTVLQMINSGCYDDLARHWANELRECGNDIYVRFAHEFNGHWYPWSPGAGTSPEAYVSAWRRLHGIFADRGAGNVRWIWAANAGLPDAEPLAQWYPGDEAVDVLGIDGYNWGTTQPASQWQSPAEVFAPAVDELRRVNADMPILITEVACAEAGGDKAAWITAFVDWVHSADRVDGFIWFDHDKETDWRVTSSPSAAAAMTAAIGEAGR